jgi:hypothetical protein
MMPCIPRPIARCGSLSIRGSRARRPKCWQKLTWVARAARGIQHHGKRQQRGWRCSRCLRSAMREYGPCGVAGGQPYWRRTALRAEKWREMGATEFEARAIRFGILELPSIPFTSGVILPAIPQSKEDLAFGREDLRAGCAGGIYEEVGREEVWEAVRVGRMVSSAFTVWQGDGADRKELFVINFARQSRHWPKGTVRMETLPSFALQLLANDHLMSWDVKPGYRHFYLHPKMRDYFLFHYDGRYYRCVALPFGWGRSVLWFTKLMRPFVKYVRSELGYRLLPWIYDFLCAPTHGRRPAIGRDCRRARIRLSEIFGKLDLTRHLDKGCWEGSKVVEHLGVLTDTRQVRVFMTDRKVKKMQKLARELLLSAQRNRRLVSLEKLRQFCGVVVSQTLALPLARFYTRSLYWDMSLATLRAEERGQSQSGAPCAGGAQRRPSRWRSGTPELGSAQRGQTLYRAQRVREMARVKVRLSRQSLRDLVYRSSFSRGEGRDLHPPLADLTMHSDAADVGYGGTLGSWAEAGSSGLREGRGIWSSRERSESITLRELKAVRLLLQKHFASLVAEAETRRIFLHEDNQAVVHVLNAMVSASRPMMAELRRLEVMLRTLGVKLEARWIPSAINRYADALSRRWDPGDTSATDALVQSLCDAYAPDAVVFGTGELGSTQQLAAST